MLFKKKCILFALLLAVMFPLRSVAASASDSNSLARQVFDLLNRERETAQLQKLNWNERAAGTALAHAVLLAKNKRLSHQFAGESGVPERLGHSGVRFISSGENLALVDDVIEANVALMNSPGHRANILNRDYNAVGIGVVQRNGRMYVAEDFVHSVPVYSEKEFLEAVVGAFNRARDASGKTSVEVRGDLRLHNSACASVGIPTLVSTNLAGALEVVVFTLSEPHELPERLARQASDAMLKRMNIGVCFRPDRKLGNANFWVAAAFGR
ncbi:MAG: CAP domain-containing protein [Acidobacteriia bacterium]|nr:CAP domain-containing protein [Terriglobia bacterium]